MPYKMFLMVLNVVEEDHNEASYVKESPIRLLCLKCSILTTITSLIHRVTLNKLLYLSGSPV